MLMFMENSLSKGQIPEIWEDENETSKSFKNLRDSYIKYAKIHFQGKKYLNNRIGEDILVSRDGIDKLESMINSREQCLAIRLLDIFLTGSTVEGRKPDMKNRWNVDEFVYLVCQCRINEATRR